MLNGPCAGYARGNFIKPHAKLIRKRCRRGKVDYVVPAKKLRRAAYLCAVLRDQIKCTAFARYLYAFGLHIKVVAFRAVKIELARGCIFLIYPAAVFIVPVQETAAAFFKPAYKLCLSIYYIVKALECFKVLLAHGGYYAVLRMHQLAQRFYIANIACTHFSNKSLVRIA